MDKLIAEASTMYFWLTILVALGVNLLSNAFWPRTQRAARAILGLAARMGSAALGHLEAHAARCRDDADAYTDLLEELHAARTHFYGGALMAAILYATKLLAYIDSTHFHQNAPAAPGYWNPVLYISILLGLFLGNSLVEFLHLMRLSLVKVWTQAERS